MVEVNRLIDQEHVGESEREQRSAQTVETAEEDTERRNSQHQKVQIHKIARPGLYPLEAVEFEMELWLDEVLADPVTFDVRAKLPEHHCAEDDSEPGQGGGVDGREEPREAARPGVVDVRSDVGSMDRSFHGARHLGCSDKKTAAVPGNLSVGKRTVDHEPRMV